MTLFDKISYIPNNTDLFDQALTHKSFRHEKPENSKGDNERLEFLGDAVLELIITSEITARFQNLQEGELSKIRASLVNEGTLNDVALEIGLDKELKLGRGEQLTGGATKPRLLASAFEAMVGAVFQDGGWEKSKTVVLLLFATRLDSLDLSIHFKTDYKTRLQEILQERKLIPAYFLEREEGPDHDKTFFVALKVGDEVKSRGQGRSKKQAEQDAARLALEGGL